MSRPTLILDIETWPEPDDKLIEFLPPAPEPIPFDPASVKVGNLKDPDKIAAKIKDARAAHEIEQERLRDPAVRLEGIKEKACLRAAHSRIYALAISTGADGCLVQQIPNPSRDDERYLLNIAWERIKNTTEVGIGKAGQGGGWVGGWNFIGFDMPYIIQRSLILGVTIPMHIKTPLYRNDWLFDVMEWWACGPMSHSNPRYAKLNEVGIALGLGGKDDLDNKLPWEVAAEDPDKAYEYARRDVALTWAIMERIQSLRPNF